MERQTHLHSVRTCRLAAPVAFMVGLAISSHATSTTLPKSVGMCRASEAPLFDCDLTSGGNIALCLEQHDQKVLSFVERPSGRRRSLWSLEGSFGGFAHGGDAILQGRDADTLIDVFVTVGGVPDQTSGAITIRNAQKTTSLFCETATIQISRSGGHSVFLLGMDHIAAALDDAPDYPIDPNPKD